MATAAVASGSHTPNFGTQSHHAPLTTTPSSTKLDLSGLNSIDFSNLSSVDMSKLTPAQQVAVGLISAYTDGKLSKDIQEYIKATYPATSFSPSSSQSPTTAKTKKSVRWDDEQSEALGRYKNDGYTDHGSDWKKLMDNNWKGFNSRAGYWRDKKRKKVGKDHWAKREAAYTTVTNGGDEYEYVPTSTMTLQGDFPTLYRYPTRPTTGLSEVEGSKVRKGWDKVRAQWDEEDDRRMSLKLKPLWEISGPLATTGSRTTAMKSMTLSDQRTWARDFKMMEEKFMNVICDTEASRETWLGLKKGEFAPGMTRKQAAMASKRAQKTADRQAKIARRFEQKLGYNVPVLTDDTAYDSVLDTALSDFSNFQSTQAATDGFTRDRGKREYLDKLKTKKLITDAEKSMIYPDTQNGDDVQWLDDLGADEKTMRGFVQQVKRMREMSQSVVRPSAIYDRSKILERMRRRQAADASETSDERSDDESLDGLSSMTGERVDDESETHSDASSGSITASSSRGSGTRSHSSSGTSNSTQSQALRRRAKHDSSTPTRTSTSIASTSDGSESE